MNKEKLSAGNIIWAGDCAWVINSIHNNHVYAHKFNEPSVTRSIRFEDVQGIQITIASVELYMGIKMEQYVADSNHPTDIDWYDVDSHRLRLSNTWWKMNRPDDEDAKCWFCHLDNECMDSIGTADLLYINELQNFLNLFK